MKYSFKMNAEDYAEAYLQKYKTIKLHDGTSVTLIIFIIIFLVCLGLLAKPFVGAIFTALIILYILAFTKIRKSVIKNTFYSSPSLFTVQTMRIYDEGLEIINGYEKMFTPWQSIYYFKEDAKKVTVMASFRKGTVIINKQTQENTQELNLFLDELRKHIECKGAVK